MTLNSYFRTVLYAANEGCDLFFSGLAAVDIGLAQKCPVDNALLGSKLFTTWKAGKDILLREQGKIEVTKAELLLRRRNIIINVYEAVISFQIMINPSNKESFGEFCATAAHWFQ